MKDEIKQSKIAKNVEPPRWPTVRCPGCLRWWLAAGLRCGDTYTCKACSRQFIVEKQEAAGQTGFTLGSGCHTADVIGKP